MAKVLLFSNCADNRFSYSVVANRVAKGLVDAGHEVLFWGMQRIRPPEKIDGVLYCGVRYASWGSDIVPHLIRVMDIDVVITLADIFVNDGAYFEQLAKTDIGFLPHITTFGYPAPLKVVNRVRGADKIICPSGFVFDSMAAHNLDDLKLIYHGVDTKNYDKQDSEKILETKKLLGVEDLDFVALSVMRNKGDIKNFPALFAAWKNFLKILEPEQAKKCRLLVLADPKEVGGIDLIQIRNMYHVTKEEVSFIQMQIGWDGKLTPVCEGTPNSIPHNSNYSFPASTMADIYNAADVLLITSSGESFCLPVLEAAACGTPCIVNDAGALREHGNKGCGLVVSKNSAYVYPSMLTEVYLSDDVAFSMKIHDFYSDDELQDSLKKSCYEYARKDCFNWENIGKKWAELVDETVKKYDDIKDKKGLQI